jgi:hypothetical protein
VILYLNKQKNRHKDDELRQIRKEPWVDGTVRQL